MAILFARYKVADLASFKGVHAKVGAAHAAYGLTEAVWQNIDDPRSLTIAIRGGRTEIEASLRSPERTRLSQQPEVESANGNWLAE